MKIGVPTEIKVDEYRIAMTPAGVRELSSRGHDVIVQAGASEAGRLRRCSRKASFTAASSAKAAATSSASRTILKRSR